MWSWKSTASNSETGEGWEAMFEARRDEGTYITPCKVQMQLCGAVFKGCTLGVDVRNGVRHGGRASRRCGPDQG